MLEKWAFGDFSPISRATGTAYLLIRGIVHPLDSDADFRAEDCSIGFSKLFLEDKIPLFMLILHLVHTKLPGPSHPKDTPYQLPLMTGNSWHQAAKAIAS